MYGGDTPGSRTWLHKKLRGFLEGVGEGVGAVSVDNCFGSIFRRWILAVSGFCSLLLHVVGLGVVLRVGLGLEWVWGWG